MVGTKLYNDHWIVSNNIYMSRCIRNPKWTPSQDNVEHRHPMNAIVILYMRKMFLKNSYLKSFYHFKRKWLECALFDFMQSLCFILVNHQKIKVNQQYNINAAYTFVM